MRLSQKQLDGAIKAGLAKYPNDLEERIRSRIAFWKKSPDEYTEEELSHINHPLAQQERDMLVSYFEQILSRLEERNAGREA